MPSREEINEAKKARRKFRHEIARRMLRVATRRTGMFARPGQLHSDARILTDRYMYAVDHAPTQVKPIEEVLCPDSLNQPSSTPAG